MIKKIKCDRCGKYRRIGNVKVVMIEPADEGGDWVTSFTLCRKCDKNGRYGLDKEDK